MFANWNPFATQPDPETLDSMRAEQAARQAIHRWKIHNQPRKTSYTCESPSCRTEIRGLGDSPDWYTAVECWFCGSNEYTMPRPDTDRGEEEKLYLQALDEGYS